MQVIDPGHVYTVRNYDVEDRTGFEEIVQEITFMKREGEGYPGNEGHHPGTNCQELLRVLIDRVIYLDNQIPCHQDTEIVGLLNRILYMFEQRAAQRHGRRVTVYIGDTSFYKVPACPVCGHIQCQEHLEAAKK